VAPTTGSGGRGALCGGHVAAAFRAEDLVRAERAIVRANLARESFDAIGARIGVTSDAPRKLLPRIVARLRALRADPRLAA
jgi:hypothetical protein